MNQVVDRVFEQFQQETNFIVKAKLLSHLVKDKQIRIKEIADRLQMKESYICHILRLNKLNDILVDGYYSKMISISHLFIISRLHTPEDMVKVYEQVLTENLTVGQTEERVREILYHFKAVGEYIPKKEIDEIKTRIKELFPKSDLQIIQSRVKNKIIFELKGSLEETTPQIRKVLDSIAKKEEQKTG